MRTQDALRQAQEKDLDLVEVAAEAKPPVVRILDYSKYKYEQAQKQKSARKHQQQINVREIKFRPKIAQHDYDTKKGHVMRFLKARDKVKVTIMFRGREMAHTDLGRKILDRLVTDLGESIVVEAMPKQEGRNMIMVIAPNKRYQELMAKEAAANGDASDLSDTGAPLVDIPAEVIEAVEAAEAGAPAGSSVEEPQPDTANEG